MLVSDIKVLSASEIATVVDRAEEVFPVPEWGGAIKLRPLSLSQRDEIASAALINGKTDGQLLIRLIVKAGVSEPLLTDEVLRERSFAVIDRISRRIMELNGVTKKEDALTAERTF